MNQSESGQTLEKTLKSIRSMEMHSRSLYGRGIMYKIREKSVTVEHTTTSYAIGSSNVSRLRVTLMGVRAVLAGPGVRHCFCAGLGVMFTKSAKSNPCPGVLGKMLPPPGVIIMDDGRSNLLVLGGGVVGRSMRPLLDLTAGDGDAAR